MIKPAASKISNGIFFTSVTEFSIRFFVPQIYTGSKLLQLRDEARRVISAISTDSVRFLKGMNRETLDLLQRKGISLIKAILELEAPPEGISPDVWALITEDAKRLSKSD